MLIVGCGCRGRALATALVSEGHAARGTTRNPARLREIEAAGAEAVLADPNRLSTLVPSLERVSVLCWLMGTAAGEPDVVASLHGGRLEAILETIVDTPVRGVVYEAAGSVPGPQLRHGRAAVRRAATRNRVRVALIETDPRRRSEWVEDGVDAVRTALAA